MCLLIIQITDSITIESYLLSYLIGVISHNPWQFDVKKNSNDNRKNKMKINLKLMLILPVCTCKSILIQGNYRCWSSENGHVQILPALAFKECKSRSVSQRG